MDRFRSLRRLHPGRTGLLVVLLCAGTGCGLGQGEVRGTVRYNGKPLPFGTIQFLGPDGIARAGKIGPDGTFSVAVPAGEVKVIVSCMAEARLSRSTGPSAGRHGRAVRPTLSSGGYSLIPQRYADWNGSGLTVLVKRGKTVQDFTLLAK
jgi:hypothetical protein